MRTSSPAFKRLPLALAVIGCLYSASTLAQVQPQTQPEPQAQPQVEEEEEVAEAVELNRVTVTGSLLRRTEYESISPIQIITADTNVTLGQVETAEFLQQSNVAAGSTQIDSQFSGFVVEGGTGVQTLSLRGLGAGRTLVLLNGRRPGPAGTRGQVGAFDLNVIPASVLQRIEILKDGSSSIYGSDAVAGVVNLITRKSVDRPELIFSGRVPTKGGGEVFSVSGATGWNFDTGNVVLSAEWYRHEPLRTGDRDYFRCPQDLAFDASGNRIDRVDRSITAGTSLGGCNNLYANTVIDAFSGVRYIPSPDGVTIGLIPGYRPRVNPTYANSSQAAYEDQLNYGFFDTTQIIDRQERKSVYLTTDFTFGNVHWANEILFNNRQTDTHRYRQFFPLTGGATAPANFRYANSPTFVTPVPTGVAQPIMPFPSDQKIDVDYLYVTSGLDGLFGGTDTWSWQANASYSRSEGTYDNLSIVASRSGDVRFDDTAPRLDYFSPGFLSGARMDELVAAVGEWNAGETTYDQAVVTGIVTGELFNLPAGAVGAAFGAEYRHFSIDDQPSALSRNGDLWGSSSAQVTKGDDTVKEVFAEVEVPVLAGLPGIESLTFNASARYFDYDSVEDSDNVWKLGVSWQIIPSLRARATRGTSFRAPGLYELFLGDQTGFLSQLAVDPCINWGESNNEFLRANCAAVGIPDNLTTGGSSATVVAGGGAGVLRPENSDAFTAGIVFTPTFANFSVALDYFEFEVKDQIAQLGAGAILGGCYGAPVFPNAFCDLFVRNPGTDPVAPFRIDTIQNSYLNVNLQKTRGYDLQVNYDREFGVGTLAVEALATYVFEDVEQLFDAEQASGFDSNDLNGAISRPKIVGNVRTAFERGDFTYTWFMNYVDGTESLTLNPEFTYFGRPGSVRDIRAESRLYHTASVRYDQPDWALLVGVSNVLGEDPPQVSSGVASTYGNVPAFATQYDWYGRTAFVRLNLKF